VPAYGPPERVAPPAGPVSGRSAPAGLSLFGAAARVGGHVWTERRLFEVLGAAVKMLSDPAAKGMVDRHAAHAAWRAGQWWDRLPVLAVVDRDALIVPPGPGVAAAYDRMGSLTDDVGFLAGIYRVALPRLEAAYRSHATLTAPATDGAIRRTLERVGPDLEGDRAEGESWVQFLLVDATAVEVAAAAVSGTEVLLVEG
jgi:hypothetical protein